jgi:hypothetical protein
VCGDSMYDSYDIFVGCSLIRQCNFVKIRGRPVVSLTISSSFSEAILQPYCARGPAYLISPGELNVVIFWYGTIKTCMIRECDRWIKILSFLKSYGTRDRKKFTIVYLTSEFFVVLLI